MTLHHTNYVLRDFADWVGQLDESALFPISRVAYTKEDTSQYTIVANGVEPYSLTLHCNRSKQSVTLVGTYQWEGMDFDKWFLTPSQIMRRLAIMAFSNGEAIVLLDREHCKYISHPQFTVTFRILIPSQVPSRSRLNPHSDLKTLNRHRHSPVMTMVTLKMTIWMRMRWS